jgi:hypothetical protein
MAILTQWAHVGFSILLGKLSHGLTVHYNMMVHHGLLDQLY